MIRWLQLRRVDWWIKCCRCLVGRPRLWGEAEDTSKAQTHQTKYNRTTTKCSLMVTLDIGLGVCEGEVYNNEHVKHMNWLTRIHTWYCPSQRGLLTEVWRSQVSTSGASSFIQSSSFAGAELIFPPVLYVTVNTRILHSGCHCWDCSFQTFPVVLSSSQVHLSRTTAAQLVSQPLYYNSNQYDNVRQ